MNHTVRVPRLGIRKPVRGAESVTDLLPDLQNPSKLERSVACLQGLLQVAPGDVLHCEEEAELRVLTEVRDADDVTGTLAQAAQELRFPIETSKRLSGLLGRQHVALDDLEGLYVVEQLVPHPVDYAESATPQELLDPVAPRNEFAHEPLTAEALLGNRGVIQGVPSSGQKACSSS